MLLKMTIFMIHKALETKEFQNTDKYNFRNLIDNT